MRACLILLTALVAPTMLTAQKARNQIRVWDGSSEFSSRGSNLGSAGYVSQGLAHGFAAGLETLTDASYTIQDQDASTREPLTVGFALLDASGRPDYGAVKPYLSNYLPPPGSGVRAWNVTHTQTLGQTPFKVPQSLAQVHHVWHFVKPANWSQDGLSVHMSEGAPYQGTLLCWQNSLHREIPRVEGLSGQIEEELGWTGVPQGSPAPANRSWELVLSFLEPTLQGGAVNATYNPPNCLNPNPGYAALDPDFSDVGRGAPPRWDDYQWTVMDDTAVAAVLFWSQAVLPGGGVPTPIGSLHIDLADPLSSFGPLPMSSFQQKRSFFRLPLGAKNAVARSLAQSLGSWTAQALVIRPGPSLRLSNPWTMRTRALPAGFKAGRSRKGAPLAVPTSGGTLILRNDGRGSLAVQPMARSTKVGPQTVVAERTLVRIAVPPTADRVEIRGNKSLDTKFVYRP